jgi:hypothetical protein
VTRRILALALAVLTLAGCARTANATTVAAPSGTPSASSTADLYTTVLQRYLGTPSENGFDGHFPVVYVLDTAYPDAADPMGRHPGGTAIPADAQARIVAAVPGATFVHDRNSVVEKKDGCVTVKGGGILVTLGTVDGTGDEVHVGISGYVACLGATWLTYVVHRDGSTWRVTGTTGPYAIA